MARNPIHLQGGKLLDGKEYIDDTELEEDDIILLEPQTSKGFTFSENARLAVESCGFC